MKNIWIHIESAGPGRSGCGGSGRGGWMRSSMVVQDQTIRKSGSAGGIAGCSTCAVQHSGHRNTQHELSLLMTWKLRLGPRAQKPYAFICFRALGPKNNMKYELMWSWITLFKSHVSSYYFGASCNHLPWIWALRINYLFSRFLLI